MIKIKSLILTGLSVLIIGLAGFSQSTQTYDENIKKVADRLLQYPGRTKDLPFLKENYDMAMKTDQESIRKLLATGQPDIWNEIYHLYLKMESRQKLVQRLPSPTLKLSGIEFVTLNTSLLEAKHRASAYHYARAEKLLGTGKPSSAREAYQDLLIVAGIGSDYKELDKQIRRAVLTGTTKMEFDLYNRTGKTVSNAMIDHLTRVIWEYKKARAGQNIQEEPASDLYFTIRVVLTDFQVGPDQVRELEYYEERDLYSGDQVVDTIRCKIQEFRQLKKAQLSGALEYYDHRAGQVINTVPIKVETIFTNAYATLQGDPQAAGDATRLLLAAKKAAYPTHEQMILDVTEEFAKKASEVILAE